MRADARRNRDLLLATAREVFEERGPDVAIDEIARRAGIGNATLYRHFPTRGDLLSAVYADEVDALCAQGRALLDVDPGESAQALFGWLRAFVAHVAVKRGLALAIPDDRSGRRADAFEHWHTAMRSTTERLLARARAEGTVHADVTADDLLVLANAIALASPEPTQAERSLDLLRRGVATR